MSIIDNLRSSNVFKNIKRNRQIELQLQYQWNIISNNNKFKTSIGWKELINHSETVANVSKDRILLFRNNLNNYIINLCSKFENTVCTNPGSTKRDSDIDVTISGNYNTHIFIIILDIFKKIFGKDQKFFDNNIFDVQKVCKFFDINFYITDFAIVRNHALPVNKLSSYYLTDDYYKKTPDTFTQYDFATWEYDDKPVAKDIEDYIKYGIKINSYIDDLKKRERITQHNMNNLIKIISYTSLYQDECYHTQGAFFHVVLMMQKNIDFIDKNKYAKIYDNMMGVSIVENLVFGLIHNDRRTKYINRVLDALHRIINKNFFIYKVFYSSINYQIQRLINVNWFNTQDAINITLNIQHNAINENLFESHKYKYLLVAMHKDDVLKNMIEEIKKSYALISSSLK